MAGGKRRIIGCILLFLGAVSLADLYAGETTGTTEDLAAKADAYEDPTKAHRVRLRETAVAAFHDGGPAAAEVALDAYLNEMVAGGMRERHVYGAVWREAQLHAGAEYPALAEVFYRWILMRSTDGDLSGASRPSSDLILLGNLIGSCDRQGKQGESRRWTGFIERRLAHLGIETDTSLYRDAGPVHDWMPEARRRDFPLRWEDQINSTSKSSRFIDYGRISGILDIAEQAWDEGDWVRAVEMATWARSYGEAQRDNPQGNSDFTQSHIWLEHHNANALLSDIFWAMGAEEEALSVVEESLNLPGGAYWSWHWDYYRKLIFLSMRGEVQPLETLRGLENNLPRLEANKYASNGLVFRNLQAQVWLDYAAGRVESAFERLADLENGPFAQRNGTMELRIQLSLRERSTDPDLEAVFIRLLDKYRKSGLKMSEPKLYRWYAQYLADCGRLEEAVQMQEEARRLYRALGMRARTLEAEVVLAAYVAMAGQDAHAKLQTARARRALTGSTLPLPGSMEKRIKNLLKGNFGDGGIFHVGDKEIVDLQPRLVTTETLPGFPAYARFTLANPSAKPQTGTLRLQGPAAAFTTDSGSATIRATLETGQPVNKSTLSLTLAPGELVPIHLRTNPMPFGQSGRVEFSWSESTAHWDFRTGGASDFAVVTEANLIRHNPFYLVPIHHTLLHPGNEAPSDVDFRMVASEVGRIEVYDAADGTLIYIDANGDGDILDSGDLLARDANANHLPDIGFPSKETPVGIEAYFQSQGHGTAEVTIHIELFENGRWVPQAQNEVEASPAP